MAFDSVILLDELSESVPPQIAAVPFWTVSPAGSVSVKPIPVCGVASPLVIVKVSCEVPLTEITDGLNDEMRPSVAARAGDARPANSTDRMAAHSHAIGRLRPADARRPRARHDASQFPSMTAPPDLNPSPVIRNSGGTRNKR